MGKATTKAADPAVDDDDEVVDLLADEKPATQDESDATDDDLEDEDAADDPPANDPSEAPGAGVKDQAEAPPKARKARAAKPAPTAAPVVADTTKSSAKSKLLKISGLKAEDILGWNEETHTAVTQQGGKYRLDEDGETVHHLAGPGAPNLPDFAQVAEQARLEAAANR